MNNTIYLREIAETDLPLINQWRQDQELIAQLADGFRYVNLETDEQWFANYCAQREHNIRLAICMKNNNAHIGNVYLLNIDSIAHSAVFHIFIGDAAHRSKGYGKQATLLCLEHGFKDRNLQRISLTVLQSNQQAIALYENCGLTKEGVLRQAAFKNGQYVNVCVMSILRDEFFKQK